MIQNDVFERRGENTISSRLFYGLLFLFTYTGLIGVATTAHIAVSKNYEPSLFDGFLFCFAIPILGMFITSLNKGLWTSFIGYNIVIVPLGFILGPLMKGIGGEYVVRDIYIQTIITTCIVGCIGSYSPSTFNNKRNLIFATISGILVTLIIYFFCSLWEQITWIQIIIVTSFSFYITHHFYRARTVSRTVRNSIDIASRLYLDVVTFFLKLLITNDQKQTRSGY